mmetsp:Transcript_62764/g.196595  ORF Transcript_62764/g.196595 Transcript_62764/m.196595 type:complete len:399 (-) Transcript_62764:53-1249(-)
MRVSSSPLNVAAATSKHQREAHWISHHGLLAHLPELQRDAEGIVVAAGAAQVPLVGHAGAAQVREDVVDAAKPPTRVDARQLALHRLHRHRARAGIEVAHEDDGVTRSGLARHQLQQVVSRGVAAAEAAAAQGQRAVMHQEEHNLAGLPVLQAEPDRQALAVVVALASAILCHELLAMRQLLPGRLAVGRADCDAVLSAAALVGKVCVAQAAVAKQAPGVLALLEPDEVVGPAAGHEVALPAALAALLHVDLPPLQVVGQDLDQEWRARRRHVLGRGRYPPAVHLALRAPGVGRAAKVGGLEVVVPGAAALLAEALALVAVDLRAVAVPATGAAALLRRLDELELEGRTLLDLLLLIAVRVLVGVDGVLLLAVVPLLAAVLLLAVVPVHMRVEAAGCS